MTLQISPCSREAGRSGTVRALAVALTLGAALLAGCNSNKDKPATQTAAKVNKEEITVHQINFLLSQQRGIAPAQAASASRQVLERLIDQELTLQKASDQRLDRDPRVVLEIEAARREIISRAYLDKLGDGAPKPTPAEVEAYYQAHPGLFSDRRVYSLQELNIEATPEQVEAMKKALASSKTIADFVAYLKANNIRFAGGEAVRAAEQLPLTAVDQFAKLKAGQAIFNTRPGGAQVINVAAVRVEPVTLDRARPAIEQFLLNERKRKLIADDLQALRSAAKIEYVGEFAADAAKHPYQPASSPELPPLTTLPATQPASEVKAAPQVDVAPIDSGAASAPNAATLDRGLKGFK
jgi:EpsD family peptidyl-prolyl cis-trans isomerase